MIMFLVNVHIFELRSDLKLIYSRILGKNFDRKVAVEFKLLVLILGSLIIYHGCELCSCWLPETNAGDTELRPFYKLLLKFSGKILLTIL
jgi:hypothetical protein